MEASRTDEHFRQVGERLDRLEGSIADFRVEVRDSIAELRQEIKDSNAELRKEIKDSNTGLREEIKGSNAELRDGLRVSNAEQTARVDKLQHTLLQIGSGMIGAMLVVFGSVVATQL